MTELDVTGSSAFRRLFTEQISSVEVRAARRATSRPRSRWRSAGSSTPTATLREQAAGAMTEALRPGLRTRAYVFNTLLADKATKDRLRDYPHWLASRNLANEASDESVEALIEAVSGRYELARRWYRLKAGLLGLDRLAYWDRMAPVGDTDEHIPYDEARAIVLDCYSGFSPELGEVAAGFFADGYIDGPPRPGKRGGAFCSYTVPSRHPYVMLNYTSRPYDVLTLAHELGHGVHAALARPAGHLPVHHAADAGRDGLDLRRDDRAGAAAGARPGRRRAAVAAGRVARRRGRRRLPPGRDEPLRARGPHRPARAAASCRRSASRELWLDTQADLLGDSVELHDDYGIWWSYVPHFVDTPGYVYAYAYGHLLALSVYRRYEQEGEGFVSAYLELLRAGGSRPPEELGADRRRGPGRPGLLELGPRPDRAPARGGRARRRGGRHGPRDRRRSRSGSRCPLGEVALTRPRDAEALLDRGGLRAARSSSPTGPSSGRAAWRSRTTSPGRSLRGARVLELGCGLGLPSIAAALAGGRVLATDWSADAVRATAANAALNDVDGRDRAGRLGRARGDRRARPRGAT